ncbi:TPA: hypothetical protein ACPY17_004823 [Citrobacter freundii]
METPNSFAVQNGAFDTIIRAMVATMDDAHFQRFSDHLNELLSAIEKANTHPQISAQLAASADMARAIVKNGSIGRKK